LIAIPRSDWASLGEDGEEAAEKPRICKESFHLLKRAFLLTKCMG
jgi:hypothetical protein